MNGPYKLPKPRAGPSWRPGRDRRREMDDASWRAACELAERAWRRRLDEALDRPHDPPGG